MRKRGKERGRSWFLNPKAWIPLILLLVFASLLLFSHREPATLTLRYGEFKQILQAPGVGFRNLTLRGGDIRGELVTRDRVSGREAGADGDEALKVTAFRTPRRSLENDPQLQRLLDEKVGSGYQADDEETSLRNVFGSPLFLLLVIVGLVLLALPLLRAVSGTSSPFAFGRSRHKLHVQKDRHVTFDDVAGISEAVAELREVVDFLKRPAKYQALGGRIPKGVLLVGPPGTGKTLLARAVAGEANVPFFSMSGSDFVEMFVGVGASRVRDLFRDAEAKAPCIIFIDELDALGKSRAGGGLSGGHDEREQTLNQLLVEMDGFDTNRGVIIMAATNRPETLDAALLRPGRFDRQVVVDRPDIEGREAILRVHARAVKLADDVQMRRVASLTPGAVGADLANLVNEAALLAARRGKDLVSMSEFNEAVERNAVGLERKSRVMRADEKRRVAVHEAGHALIACAFPESDPVHKVSIIPRGVGALGYVLRRPDDDRHLMTRSELEAHIKVALGGTLAEELVYGEISNGSGSDLDKANQIARRMVKEYGMSRLGRIFIREQESATFLPGALGDAVRDHSEETAREIDLEVRALINENTEAVMAILRRNRLSLEGLAQRLIEKEVIDGAELHEVLDKHGFTPDVRPALPLRNGGAPAASETGNKPCASAS
jgi:cell division protease FtsH